MNSWMKATIRNNSGSVNIHCTRSLAEVMQTLIVKKTADDDNYDTNADYELLDEDHYTWKQQICQRPFKQSFVAHNDGDYR